MMETDEKLPSPPAPIARAAELEMAQSLQRRPDDLNEVNGAKVKDSALHSAVESGDLVMVKLIIGRNRIDCNCIGKKGNTPLHVAAWKNHLNIVEFLVEEKNADLDIINDNGEKPLHVAVQSGHSEVVKFLIEKKGGFNSVFRNGDTLLCRAARNKCTEVVKVLVENDADLTKVDRSKQSPLQISVENGSTEIVKILIEKIQNYCDVEFEDGDTPLCKAAKSEDSNSDIVRLLMQKGEDVVKKCSKNGESPLRIAIEKGFLDKVETLMEGMKDFDTVLEDGETPLYKAAERNHLDMVKYFVGKGADPNRHVGGSRSENNKTPMEAAIEKNHLEVIKIFIEKTKNCNVLCSHGATPLYIACQKNYPDLIKFLLENGADPKKHNKTNICLQMGEVPLHAAVRNCDLEIIKLLGEKGAEYGLESLFWTNLKTLLYCAVERGSAEIARFLIREKGAKVNETRFKYGYPLHAAVRCNSLQTVKLLVEEGANLNCSHELTPSMLAGKLGHYDILKYFVEETASDLNQLSVTKKSNILHFSVYSRNIDVILLVISKIPSFINTPNYDGKTPLFFAKTADVVQILVEKGANFDRMDNSGKTPLMTAVEENNVEVVRCLLQLGAEVNKSDHKGLTAAHHSVRNTEIMELLDKHKIDWGKVDNSGRSCLITAVECNEECAVNYLVERRICDVNKPDKNLSTPLHHAALIGNAEIVKVLMAGGGDCDWRDSNAMTPLDVAAKNEKLNAALCFIRNYERDVNELFILKSLALHWAVMHAELDVIKELISRGADFETSDANGNAPIHLAALRKRPDIVSYLLELSSSCISWENKRLETPLLCAASTDSIEVIKTFINHGADVHKKDINGNSLLHRAVTVGSEEIVKFLIENEADVTAVDNDGRGVLHCHSKEPVINYLTTVQGIDINLADKSGLTPLMVWMKEKYKRGSHLWELEGIQFDKRDFKERTAIHWAADSGYWDTVQDLIKKFSDPFAVDEAGWNSLHIAAVKGHIHFVKLLLKSENVMVNVKQNDGKTALYLAAEQGHFTVVTNLIKKGASGAEEANNGLTPLHIAAKMGHVQVLEYLVNHTRTNAVDLQCSRKQTALHYSAQNGHELVVQLLFRLGAKVNIQNERLETSLHLAAAAGHRKTVELLLQNGANINVVNIHKRTALHLAAANNKFEAVEVLINNGAFCDLKDDDGFTAVHLAAKVGSWKIINLLAEFGARIDEADNNGATPLHWASFYGHTHVVRGLGLKGADTNRRDRQGSPPLHWAAAGGCKYVLKSLLEKGDADFNSVNNGRWSSLHFAAEGGHFDVILHLVSRYQADINQRDENGATPLHVAADRGHLSTVKNLIRKEAIINMQDIEGASPLHRASENGHIDVVTAMIEKGADLNCTDKFGNKPVHYASGSGFSAVVKYLIEKRIAEVDEIKKNKGERVTAPADEANDDGASPLHLACGKGRKDVVNYLLNIGAKVNCEDKVKSTPILWAAANGHIDIINLLLTNNKGRFAVRGDGCSCLHLAAENGHNETVEYLAHKGILVSGQNKQKESALHWAAGRGHLEVVKTLIEKGADVNSLDAEEKIPLYWAAGNGHDHVVTYLIGEQSQINKPDKRLRQPIHAAASGGHHKVVDTLIKNSKYPIANSNDERNVTPIHCAAENGHLEVIERLLQEQGVTLNQSSDNGWNCVHYAAFNGHLNLIQWMENANVNEENEVRQTPLHLAAMKGHTRVVEKLIEKGAECNAKDQQDFTPLLCACKAGHTETVRSLLGNESIDVHHVSDNGTSAVMYSARSGKIDIMELLLEKGADFNNVDNQHWTVLHHATNTGDLRMFAYLLQKNKELLYKSDIHDKTPMHKAAAEGHLEIIKFTIEDVLELGYERCSITSLAAEAGHKAIVEYVLEVLTLQEKLTNEELQEHVMESLIAACSNGHSNVVELLVDTYKADVDCPDALGKAPLHYAAEGGHPEVVEYLLKKNAFVDKTDNCGNTPLMLCAIAGKQAVITAAEAAVAGKPDEDKVINYQSVCRKLMDVQADLSKVNNVDCTGYSLLKEFHSEINIRTKLLTSRIY